MNLIQMLDNLRDVTACAALGIDRIPGKIAYVVSMIYTLLLIGVPLLLIIFGMLDLGKAVMASKEDEIKKGQKTFISRLIAAIILFFVLAVVRLVVTIAADDDESEGIINCIDALIQYKKQ